MLEYASKSNLKDVGGKQVLYINTRVPSETSSFSSHAKGLHSVERISFLAEHVEVMLRCPLKFKQKLISRFEKHQQALVSIDGVSAQVVIEPSEEEADSFLLVAKVAVEVFQNST